LTRNEYLSVGRHKEEEEDDGEDDGDWKRRKDLGLWFTFVV